MFFITKCQNHLKATHFLQSNTHHWKSQSKKDQEAVHRQRTFLCRCAESWWNQFIGLEILTWRGDSWREGVSARTTLGVKPTEKQKDQKFYFLMQWQYGPIKEKRQNREERNNVQLW
jgi:hypothetical protein